MRRAIAALLAVLLLVGAVAGVASLFDASAGVTYEAPDGLSVTAGERHGVPGVNPVVDSSTITLADVSFSAPGQANVTAVSFIGARTAVSSLDVSSSELTIDPDDKSAVRVSGGVTALSFEDARLDGTSQMTYSANSSGTITATGLASGTSYAAALPDGTVLNTGETSGSGEATIDVAAATDQDVVLLAPEASAVSNMAPDGSSQNSEDADLSFDVSDADFAKDSGDSVSATLYVDGSEEESWSGVAANQTLSHTVTGLSDGGHDWYVETVDSYGETGTSQTATFTVNHYSPVVDNASASPTTGQDTLQPDLSINVSDRDFAVGEDSVDVAFTFNGQNVGTDSLTSNGTATVEGVSATGGQNTWSAIATDSYGNSVSSQEFTFNSPSDLSVYNESSPTEKLTEVNATVEFYFERENDPDLIVERNATDGTLDMTGLPVDEPFVVVAQADGYFNRRIFVESLFDTQSIYMLNESQDAVQPTFRLIDFTGNYARDETVIQIQRSINGSWQTVEGDYFGSANQVSAQLSFNERHRLIILNTETGERRDLGVYTPTSSTIVELEVTSDDTVIGEQYLPTVAFSPSVGSLPAQDGVIVTADVTEQATAVEKRNVKAVSAGTVLYNQTLQGEGSTDISLDLAGTEDDVTVWVNWTTVDGQTEQVSTIYNVRETGGEHALLPVLQTADLGGDTPNTMSSLLVVVLALFTTAVSATRMGSGPSGLMGMIVVTGGALIGWVPFGWLIAGAVTWLVLSGVQNRI